MKKLQHAMSSYHYLDGTEESNKMDQEWLDKKQLEVGRGPTSKKIKSVSDIQAEKSE